MAIKNLQKLSFVAMCFFLFYGCTPEEPAKTLALPEVGTEEVINISYNTATSGGYVFTDKGLAVTARGVCWSLHSTPTVADSVSLDGTGTGSFTSKLGNLIPDTIYYVRAYATNSDGTGYGSEYFFRTIKASIPVLTTIAIPRSNTTLEFGGNITASGGSAILSKGVVWSESPNPTKSDHDVDLSSGNFSSIMSDLVSGVSYYFKAYATNAKGTAYGSEIKVTMPIADREGHNYHAVTIGTQTWMVENLRTGLFRDSTVIPNKSYDDFDKATTAVWTDFTMNSGLGGKYGHMYNWYAVNDPHNLAPEGWHVASDAEWTTLSDFLGGLDVAGGKLKKSGTDDWNSPNTGATNSSGFTALPGGWYYTLYFNMNRDASFWTSTPNEGVSTEALSRFLYYNSAALSRESLYKNAGLSVRCVRDR